MLASERLFKRNRGGGAAVALYIAEQLGHEDPGLTFRVYQRAVKRRDRPSGPYCEAFDRALE